MGYSSAADPPSGETPEALKGQPNVFDTFFGQRGQRQVYAVRSMKLNGPILANPHAIDAHAFVATTKRLNIRYVKAGGATT